ncbi:uncharacterized protein DUF4267 [Stackebrandtia albiflava]|uniref:Uncharacterized protein DUF4267 n=1 Tax=Stackebrandtia albiflava TaxID=406432 RepID=A0A562V265_9ACTN|nr:DUF4267 domain-containing protein [Stackebrandtia albiflava]TWJ12000.1 uncharacterized protein DUF4267 [Stackebrandtia albiflava]
MLIHIANALTGLLGVGLILMGTSAIWAPRNAAGFGIPDTPTEDHRFRSWLAVKSVRDIVYGVSLLILLAGATPQLLGWYICAVAATPVADAVIVARSGGPKTAVYGVHGATAVVMLAIGLLLLLA